MVGSEKLYQGQRVQVVGVVNGDEVVVQFADGSRQPVNRSELSDIRPAAPRPIITKAAEPVPAPTPAPEPVVVPISPEPVVNETPAPEQPATEPTADAAPAPEAPAAPEQPQA